MNPETTTYGVYATNRPIFDTPRTTWKSPASTTTVRASVRVEEYTVMTAAIAIAIGAVGPEIFDLVPPNTAEKKPRIRETRLLNFDN